jgi:muconolactone delta-isomerase
MEYFVEMTTHVPDATPARTVDAFTAVEAVRARELADEGRLLRLWMPPNPPGVWRTLGLWSARDGAELTTTLESLPLHVWMTVDAIPLTIHPSDPVNGTKP